jgi:hypothetical protein
MADETAVLFETPRTPVASRPLHRPGLIAEIALAVIGATLILLAVAADGAWLDRHSLPHMFLSRGQQLIWWQAERALAMLAGVLLAWPVRRWVGRRVRDGRGGELAVQCLLAGIAIPLSLVASELILRTATWRGVDRWAASEEPLRRTDPYLGWNNLPDRTGWEQFGGRRILYYVDGGGHRIGDPGSRSTCAAGRSCSPVNRSCSAFASTGTRPSPAVSPARPACKAPILRSTVMAPTSR